MIVRRDGVGEECDIGGVGDDLFMMLDDPRRPCLDRILKLAATVVAVNPLAQCVAGGEIGGASRTHLVPRGSLAGRRPGHFRHRLRASETGLRVRDPPTTWKTGL